jgi:hypothetical protein
MSQPPWTRMQGQNETATRRRVVVDVVGEVRAIVRRRVT